MPVSIIIVGVGNADFDAMDELDGVYFIFFIIKYRMMVYMMTMEERLQEI